MSVQITPHSCTIEGQYRCEGTECGDIATGERYDGVCDKDGCDFNPYRLGVTDFYGPGSQFTVDSTRKFSVVTQWITDDGTDSGTLTEIKRYYVQDGNVIENPMSNVDGLDAYNSVTQENCDAQKELFGDINSFKDRGGMENMGKALSRGMTLVMSLWDDHYAHMLWLDADYPTDVDPNTPGVHRGPCSTSSGDPQDVESQHANSKVAFSNIRYGDLNSTFAGTTAKYNCNSGYCAASSSGSFDSLSACQSSC